MRFSYTVLPGDIPTRLDAFLAHACSRSRVFIQSQIGAKRIAINAESVTKASTRLRAGDCVTGEFEEAVLVPAVEPLEGALDILYEDDALLVLNKAQGVVVHPAIGHRGETLVHFLLHHFEKSATFRELSPTRPGIVHRLDRGTSGCLLIAKTRHAQENLSAQFKNRTIKKEYEAVVWGRPPVEGVFRSAIGRDRIDRKKMSSRTDKGRESLTLYRRQTEFPHFAHLLLFPHTGRTHQLRVHLAEGKFPIVGDAIYGGTITPRRTQALGVGIQNALAETTETFLHARALTLFHPESEKLLQFNAPRPKNLERFLNILAEEDK